MSRGREEFSSKVKRAAWVRCGGDTEPRCEECGASLKKRRFQYDHIKPAKLGGPATLENCKVLCSGGTTSCHAIKTRADNAGMTKADNQRKAHLDLKPPPKALIESRGFPKREKGRAVGVDLPRLPPRRLFEPKEQGQQ